MTPEEREQLNYLCSRIKEEKDPITFDGLVRELYDLLELQLDRFAVGVAGRQQVEIHVRDPSFKAAPRWRRTGTRGWREYRLRRCS